MQKIFFKTFIYLILSSLVFNVNSSFAQSGCSVVIQAISINPGNCNGGVDCDTPSEYIEIFNPCFEPLEVGCSVICDGGWCVTLPTGMTLQPQETLALGSATSPGFDADNEKHIDIHNCNGCAWLNPSSEPVELGALADGGEQIALFDAEGSLLQGLFWNGGQAPAQSTFPVDLIIEEANGCAAKALTLPDPASSELFTEVEEVENACMASVHANNSITKICESDTTSIAIGATGLSFKPYEITGCLYTGETVNIALNAEGKAASPFWTLSCGSNLPDPEIFAIDVFCDEPGIKTVLVLLQNELTGYTYQYQEDIEIVAGLDGVGDLKDQEVCLGEDINFQIPLLEGLDSQMVVVSSPPNEPQTLTDDFTVDIQDIEETSTITFVGYHGNQDCEIRKEVTITVLAADDATCMTAIEDYNLLLETHVFPNPANQFVQLQYELNTNGESNIDLFNARGQKVLNESILSYAGKNQHSINIEQLPDGIYMLNISANNERVSFKFIKE